MSFDPNLRQEILSVPGMACDTEPDPSFEQTAERAADLCAMAEAHAPDADKLTFSSAPRSRSPVARRKNPMHWVSHRSNSSAPKPGIHVPCNLAFREERSIWQNGLEPAIEKRIAKCTTFDDRHRRERAQFTGFRVAGELQVGAESRLRCLESQARNRTPPTPQMPTPILRFIPKKVADGAFSITNVLCFFRAVFEGVFRGFLFSVLTFQLLEPLIIGGDRETTLESSLMWIMFRRRLRC